jgi:hypothetical protein
MTFRAIWTPPGHFAPEHADFPTQAEADEFARKRLGEVAVVEIEES